MTKPRGSIPRTPLFLLVVFAMTNIISTRAQAQNFPWCAVLNMGDATYNCGFETREQCMATVSGTGGYCEQNTQYVPETPEPNGAQRRPYSQQPN
jgi:Protein of unknown function (DUF3551)